MINRSILSEMGWSAELIDAVATAATEFPDIDELSASLDLPTELTDPLPTAAAEGADSLRVDVDSGVGNNTLSYLGY